MNKLKNKISLAQIRTLFFLKTKKKHTYTKKGVNIAVLQNSNGSENRRQ